MSLSMPDDWHFQPPGRMPATAVSEFEGLINKLGMRGQLWDVLELFKGSFGDNSRSSSESWALSDLQSAMSSEAENAPLFLCLLWKGWEEAHATDPMIPAPKAAPINAILVRHDLPYELEPPLLLARHAQTPVTVMTPHRTEGERAGALIRRSLEQADRLLLEQRGRPAVQEILWLLETVSTGFKGETSGTGTVEGKYFNQIVKALVRNNRGNATQQALEWMVTMHGYLSSPSGGGVRHGTDLRADVSPSLREAHLYCNLTKSYINYLLAELAALSGDEAIEQAQDLIDGYKAAVLGIPSASAQEP